MPFDAVAAMSFTVNNALTLPAAVSFQVANATRPVDAVDFDVSRAMVDSWEASSLWFAHRVKVNGVLIPEGELGVALEIDDVPVDSHTGEWTFSVVGRNWGVTQTEKVFSRGTQVELYLKHGVEGAVIEPATPDYSGFVIGCDQSSSHVPIVTVRCGDAASGYDKYLTCLEAEPFAGLTRKDITEELAIDAGFATVTGPEGEVYTKPLQLTNKRLFDVLKALWEPEGCAIRTNGYDNLEVWKPRIKLAPEAPDHTWHKRDVVSLRAVPPEDCPSRWVLTGSSVVVVSEAGYKTESTVQVIEAEYAARVATEVQDAAGVQSSSGIGQAGDTLIVVTRRQTETTKRGNRIVTVREREWGWYNPAAARLVSTGGAGGTAGGGFDFMVAWINAEGKFVQWSAERFVLILDRLTTYGYTGTGPTDNQSGLTVLTRKYTKRPKGVRTVGSDPDQTDITNTYVYDNDNSYAEAAEFFGDAEQQQIAYLFQENGPRTKQVEDTYTYYGIGCRVDGAISASHRVRYDGKGQLDETATWRKVTTRTIDDLLSSDRLVTGKVEALSEWSTAVKADGAYDWGGYRSDAEAETFGRTESETTSFTATSETQVEEVNYPAEGGRVPRLFLGSLPTPLYSASVWTSFQTEPFEQIVSDATALEWFGYEPAVFSQEFTQNAAEALVVINNRRRRRLCPKFEVTRPDHVAKVGDTIFLLSEDDAVAERCIITRKHRTWGPGYMPMAAYRLEAWSG